MTTMMRAVVFHGVNDIVADVTPRRIRDIAEAYQLFGERRDGGAPAFPADLVSSRSKLISKDAAHYRA